MRWAGSFTLVLVAVSLWACGSKDSGDDDGEAGDAGSESDGSGGYGNTGGRTNAGGSGGRASGGRTSGGSSGADAGSTGSGAGGRAGGSGGTSGSGDSGGSDSGGGDPGGSDPGGSDPGGSDSGGSDSGGSESGGSESGGSDSGGGGTVSGGSGGVGQCDPVDMSSWEPPAYVPARSDPGACTAQEIQDYYDQCFWAFGGTKDCTPFEAGGPSEDCGACLAPSALDANGWGPILSIEPQVYLYESNVAGCIEILEGHTTCAAKIQAADACARAACIDVCATEVIDAAAYQDCARQARIGVCETYVQASSCISTQDVQTACSGDGFEALFVALGRVFCGDG